MASSPHPVVDEVTAGDHLRANGDVRIGSEADIRAPKGFVRLVPVAEVGIGAGYISRSGSEITASLLPF